MLETALLAAAAAYTAVVAVMYALQRRLMYPGAPPTETPEAIGLCGVETVYIPAGDGLRLLAWWLPPAAGRPVVLYWHGNAGPLHCRAQKFQASAGRAMAC